MSGSGLVMPGVSGSPPKVTPSLYSLKWNNHQGSLTTGFENLLRTQCFVDVTLSCSGQKIMAHRTVLAACSPYFQHLLADNPCEHPIIILEHIDFELLRAIIEFMYSGEISVASELITPLLRVGKSLMIRGLTDVDVPVAKSTLEDYLSTMIEVEDGEVVGKQEEVVEKIADVVESVDDLIEIKSEEELSTTGVKRKRSQYDEQNPKSSKPNWSEEQLHKAVNAVVTQKMRFTQASKKYGIPKGTLYDNILGKSKRLRVLDEAGLTALEERTVLEFCCDVSKSPYNRRTKKSLAEVLNCVEVLRRARNPHFAFKGLAGFRWWWAFCKKHSIVSLHFEKGDGPEEVEIEEESLPVA